MCMGLGLSAHGSMGLFYNLNETKCGGGMRDTSFNVT